MSTYKKSLNYNIIETNNENFKILLTDRGSTRIDKDFEEFIVNELHKIEIEDLTDDDKTVLVETGLLEKIDTLSYFSVNGDTLSHKLKIISTNSTVDNCLNSWAKNMGVELANSETKEPRLILNFTTGFDGSNLRTTIQNLSKNDLLINIYTLGDNLIVDNLYQKGRGIPCPFCGLDKFREIEYSLDSTAPIGVFNLAALASGKSIEGFKLTFDKEIKISNHIMTVLNRILFPTPSMFINEFLEVSLVNLKTSNTTYDIALLSNNCFHCSIKE